MDSKDREELAAWLTGAGLAGTAETEILAELCRRLVGLGVPVDRAVLIADTLHPIHEGHLFTWDSVRRGAESREYGR